MRTHFHLARFAMAPSFVLFFLFAGLAASLPAQEPDAPPGEAQDPAKIGDRESQGLAREEMWRAPTAEDWQKPVTIEWERTWEDALAVSKETGKPILVCVNMDGEIASEHYAGIRYRQPEVGELFSNYVCLIASTYRHNPRDHDEQGRRILCPRFGGVTCEEHIRVEPLLYEKFFEGTRVSPRHIMVEPEGVDGKGEQAEVFDVFYTWDTASVFDRIQQGLDERQLEPTPFVRGDRTLVERVASRAAADREAVEKAFREGDDETRRKLLQAAIANADADPIGLLRLAIQGLDEDQARMAREALAKVDHPGATELLADALAVPLPENERQALVAALERIGERSARARTLAVAYTSAANGSRAVDVSSWVAGATYEPASYDRVAERAEMASRRAASLAKDSTDYAKARLDESVATLQLALDPSSSGRLARNAAVVTDYRRLMLADARRALQEAESALPEGADAAGGWKLHAARALLAANDPQPDLDTAYAEAALAVPAMGTDAEEGYVAFATLKLFAEGRRKQIVDAIRKQEQWPGEWLADMDAAYRVIAEHPLGTDLDVVTHVDFLDWMRAWRRATSLLEIGLRRFPESWVLRDRERGRILRRRGIDGLLSVYREQLEAEDAPMHLRWFAAYAAIVAAESYRRADDRDQALTAYDRALELYDAHVAAHPETKPNCDHYAALCLAGKGRIAFERGQLDDSVALLLASFDRCPEAAAALDGLNLSPVDTAKQVRSACEEAGRDELVARITAAFAELRPDQLELPAYERGGPQPPQPRQGGARRGRGAQGQTPQGGQQDAPPAGGQSGG
jgi:hypothetical protein